MLRKTLFTFGIVMLLFSSASAQKPTQTVRGKVVDKATQQAVIGAIVRIQSPDTLLGIAADEDGQFKFVRVPIGDYKLSVTYTGFNPIQWDVLRVGSGKEVVLQLEMEENPLAMNTVEIVAESNASDPINSMSAVSARTFSVEETQKFAAAVNDPGRMAVSFAGVVATDDGGNTISVRGNGPSGVLWRMEGLDIPNPNHFANTASSGGGISILSAQTLSNSDFVSGAFSAEYGNALSAVFDLHLRKGNNERREYTIQAGLLGLEAAVEGPFKKGYDGSYLINYRYSTLSLVGKLGVNIGDAVTNFQDLSFHFYLPSKKAGQFQVFGFAGWSDQVLAAQKDTSEWEYIYQRYNTNYYSNTFGGGVKHLITLNDKTFMDSGISYGSNYSGYYQEKLSDDFTPTRDYQETFMSTRIALRSNLNYKISPKHKLRAGVIASLYLFDLNQEQGTPLEEVLNVGGDMTTMQYYAQVKSTWNERWTTQLGVHVFSLPATSSTSIEPRASVKYALTEKTALALGYGLHSQMQPLGIYFAKRYDETGAFDLPNRQLDFSKAHHGVLAVEHNVNRRLFAKMEVYYQHLYQVPVAMDGSSLSVINNVYGYITEPLINSGLGRNKGVELTVDQRTVRGWYGLLSLSLYDSEYRDASNTWRNTRFNGGYATALTAGKEWHFAARNSTLGVNMRALFSGGLRTTPIDLAASIAAGEQQVVDEQAYELKNAEYFRIDVRLSYRKNRSKTTSTWAFDLQNATNRKNIFGEYYEPEMQQIRTIYQAPLIPILSYRLEF